MEQKNKQPLKIGRTGLNVPFPLTMKNQKDNDMWRKSIMYCNLAVALALAGCVEHDSVGDGGGEGVISFSSGVSRAAITEDDPMTSFGVWGYYAKDGGSSTNDVFGGEQEVTGSSATGEWTYFPAQYWVLGATYEFHAVYPADVKRIEVTSNADGGGHDLDIYMFDATKGVDLMMARATGIRHDDAGSVVPVALSFKHLLARVEFVGRVHDASVGIAGFVPRIHSAKLYGMDKEADFSTEGVDLESAESIKAGWNILDVPSTEISPFANAGERLELGTTEQSIFGDVLLFPQNVTREYMFEVTYSTDEAGTERITRTVPLSTMAVSEWKAGMYYRYTFTVSVDNRILFDVPTVTPWGEASGGIIIVD